MTSLLLFRGKQYLSRDRLLLTGPCTVSRSIPVGDKCLVSREMPHRTRVISASENGIRSIRVFCQDTEGEETEEMAVGRKRRRFSKLRRGQVHKLNRLRRREVRIVESRIIMYYVEPAHHSAHDNTGLLPTDQRYKPTSKQKNAVSLAPIATLDDQLSRLEYQANVGKDPWDSTVRYGYWLTYYCSAIFAAAILCNVFIRLLSYRRYRFSFRNHQADANRPKTHRRRHSRLIQFCSRPIAFCRLIAYHTVPFKMGRYPKSLTVALIAVTFIWTSVVCFAKHPYCTLSSRF